MTDQYRYKDLDLDMNLKPDSKDITRLFDENAIKRSLRNLILMERGDKPFNPTVGSRVTTLLFEPFNPIVARLLQEEISEVIYNHEPRVDLIGVQVEDSSDENAYRVFIAFNILNREQPVNIDFLLRRLR